jgi:hypothetical protein
MQHHLISWPDNTSPQEPALFAGTQSELNRAVFRLNQLLRLLRVDFELVLRRPIETAVFIGSYSSASIGVLPNARLGLCASSISP